MDCFAALATTGWVVTFFVKFVIEKTLTGMRSFIENGVDENPLVTTFPDKLDEIDLGELEVVVKGKNDKGESETCRETQGNASAYSQESCDEVAAAQEFGGPFLVIVFILF